MKDIDYRSARAYFDSSWGLRSFCRKVDRFGKYNSSLVREIETFVKKCRKELAG